MAKQIRWLTLCTICCTAAITLPAQQSLTGIILGEGAKPLQGASVLLLLAKDSALVKGATTNAKGMYRLDNLLAGTYIIQGSYEGYADFFSVPFSFTEKASAKEMQYDPISLSIAAKELNTVSVVAKKPPFEQKIDRLLINVKSSITNAGSTVLDVLERSPGIIINRANNSIAINGKDGVVVMINGKINYMQPEAILQMLNGLNATQVERIELITTPPAKYDAGGNAGYINIVLSSSPDEGFNGSYNASAGVGHGTNASGGLNMNYRKKAVNVYGDYAYSRLAQKQVFSNYRSVDDFGAFKEIDGVSKRDPSQTNHNARAGIDYQLGKNTVIGALLSGYSNKWEMNAVNTSYYKLNQMVDTLVIINNEEVNHWKHWMTNLNLQHQFSNKGELQLNLDYLHYWNENPTYYNNQYYNSSGDYLSSVKTKSDKETIIGTWVMQADYSKQINPRTNMQFGLKGVSSMFTNDVLVAEEKQSVWVPDERFTANYALNEYIGAAYLSFDKQWNEKTSVKAGLRYEYTNTHLQSEKEKDIVNRKYGNLFPTFYISHKINEQNGLNFSYSRRITRPTFNQLAPFLIFFDPKTFTTGNPAVQPSFTDAVKLDYLYKRLVLSAGYAFENQTIARFLPETNSEDNTQIMASQNLDNSQSVFISAGIPFTLTSWWKVQLNLSGNWNQLKGTINKQLATFSQAYVSISASQSFNMPQKFSAEIFGFYQSTSYSFGAFLVQPFGAVNVALSKKFEKLSGSLVFGIDNAFNTLVFNTSVAVPGQGIVTKGTYQFSYPLFKLTWSQQFGNKVLKQKRSRATASEEERGRVE